MKAQLDEQYGLNGHQSGYPDLTSSINLNVVKPPKFVKILSNKGGYKYILPDTEFFAGTELIVEN